MTLARYIVGDVFDVLAKLPDDSVDLVFTSPPFLALRSYLPADHPDKDKEIGSEPTPGAFIDTMLDVTEEVARVLAPHGSLCVELGDTYSGSGGAGGDYGPDGLREGQPKFRAERNRSMQSSRPGMANTSAWTPRPEQGGGAGWPLAKSLCLIPDSYRWALTYGHNPFNGRPTDPWRVRNVVRWHRPNPPVGALGDKFRPATSDVVVACKSRARWFDLDAVRTPYSDRFQRGIENGEHRGAQPGAIVGAPVGERVQMAQLPKEMASDHAGAPPLDTWVIPTAPYKGAHYATFPPDLVVRPVKAMCPERVCRTCGVPSTRIVDVSYTEGAVMGFTSANGTGRGGHQGIPTAQRIGTTTGWTDCGHDDWRRGVVLDPFAGSGTVLAVATGHGRDAIGIDLDERNADLARDRVGMFLAVEYPDQVAP